MLAIAAFLLASAVLVLPGFFAISTLFPGRPAFDRWALGAATGIAAATFLAVAAGYVSLTLFHPTWAVVAIASFLAWLRHGRGAQPAAGPEAAGWALGLVLALVAVSRFGITFFHELPPGFDPTFHLILARKIQIEQGMIFDWSPFQAIPLKYPVGSHFLVVVTAALARLPLHAVFQLMTALLGVLQTALTFSLGRRLTGSSESALYAALAFGLWADYGSIGYHGWGGLPNELAMCLLLAILLLVTTESPGWRSSAASALLWAGIIVSHHHMTLVAIAVGCALFALFLVRAREGRRHVTVLAGAVGGALLSSFYAIPFALETLRSSSPHVWRYEEVLFGPREIASSLGWAFTAAVVLGGIVYLADRRTRFDPTLACVVATITALFVTFEYVYRYVALKRLGHDYVALTPSRFLTDLTCFLALYAGYGLARARARLGLGRAAFVLVTLAIALSLWPRWKEMAKGDTVPTGFLEAGAWIADNTSTDTIVVDTNLWVPYATWRKSLATPLPVSEPIDLAENREPIVRKLLRGAGAPSSPEMKLVGFAPGPPTDRRSRLLWQHPSGLSVVQYWPLEPR